MEVFHVYSHLGVAFASASIRRGGGHHIYRSRVVKLVRVQATYTTDFIVDSDTYDAV